MVAEEIPVNFPDRLLIITASANRALPSESITEEMCEELLKALNLSTMEESSLKVEESAAHI